MERTDIFKKLETIFQGVFKNDKLEIKETFTAKDIEDWDSITHMLLITEVENTFNIKFKFKELNKLKNIGDIVDAVVEKLND